MAGQQVAATQSISALSSLPFTHRAAGSQPEKQGTECHVRGERGKLISDRGKGWTVLWGDIQIGYKEKALHTKSGAVLGQGPRELVVSPLLEFFNT